jgi:DNA-binding response OmpR family regulator
MREKVLIVDDEKEIVSFLERFLGRFNVSVITATSGKEALDLYREHSPGCVLLDIQMPDIDGMTILQQLRTLNPELKIIMITGKEDKSFQEKAKRYGAIDYITKPLDLVGLSRKIKEHILKE